MDGQTNLQGLVGGTNQENVPETGALWWKKEAHTQNFELYSGGFVGIDFNNLPNLQTDINTLIIDPVNQLIDGFGGKEDTWNQGLKGKAQTAAIQYVQAVKDLLRAYASTYNNFIELANKSAQALIANDEGNKAIIENATTDIQTITKDIETEAATIDVGSDY